MSRSPRCTRIGTGTLQAAGGNREGGVPGEGRGAAAADVLEGRSARQEGHLDPGPDDRVRRVRPAGLECEVRILVPGRPVARRGGRGTAEPGREQSADQCRPRHARRRNHPGGLQERGPRRGRRRYCGRETTCPFRSWTTGSVSPRKSCRGSSTPTSRRSRKGADSGCPPPIPSSSGMAGGFPSNRIPASARPSSFAFPPPKGKVPAPTSTRSDGWSGQGRILVMDDEESVRDMAREMLAMIGLHGDGRAGRDRGGRDLSPGDGVRRAVRPGPDGSDDPGRHGRQGDDPGNC